MNDGVWLHVANACRDLIGLDQIIVSVAGRADVAEAALGQRIQDVFAQKSTAASDQDAWVGVGKHTAAGVYNVCPATTLFGRCFAAAAGLGANWLGIALGIVRRPRRVQQTVGRIAVR